MQDHIFTIGNDVDSAEPIDLFTQTGRFLKILGVGYPDAFGQGTIGQEHIIEFDVSGGGLLASGSLLVPGGRFDAESGDTFTARYLGDGVWRCYNFTRANAQPCSERAGYIEQYAGVDTPPGYIRLNDGPQASRSTYSRLFKVLCPAYQSFTVTAGTPGSITTPINHGFTGNEKVFFDTSNQVPGGTMADTVYYAIPTSLTSFGLANTPSGTPITLSNSNKLGCKLRRCPWGISGSSDFDLPVLSDPANPELNYLIRT